MLNPPEAKRILEAALLASQEPISATDLKRLFDGELGVDAIRKLLAAAGLGSRREIEGWIAAGRVRVNGQLAKLGDRAGPQDSVTVDGTPVAAAQKGRPRVL